MQIESKQPLHFYSAESMFNGGGWWGVQIGVVAKASCLHKHKEARAVLGHVPHENLGA